MNDTEFLSGLREQRAEAVEHLTTCYLPSVWRFVYVRVSGNRHLAEDIVSETMLALVRATSDEVTVKSPLSWLRAVANHKIQDHFRAAARVQHLIEQAGQVATEGEGPADDAVRQHERSEQRQLVRDALDELVDRQRLVLEWKYIEKLTVREIARRLDTTEKAAESLLFRARTEFREKMSRGEHEEDCQPGDLPPRASVSTSSRQDLPARSDNTIPLSDSS